MSGVKIREKEWNKFIEDPEKYKIDVNKFCDRSVIAGLPSVAALLIGASVFFNGFDALSIFFPVLVFSSGMVGATTFFENKIDRIYLMEKRLENIQKTQEENIASESKRDKDFTQLFNNDSTTIEKDNTKTEITNIDNTSRLDADNLLNDMNINNTLIKNKENENYNVVPELALARPNISTNNSESQ